MKDVFKLVSWLVAIFGWIAAVLWALIFKTTALASAFGITAICTWVVWALFLSWLFGIRRHLRRHLGVSLKQATFLEKEVGSTRVADLRRALESLYRDKGSAHTRRFGVQFPFGISLSLLQQHNLEIKPLQWSSFESQVGSFENFPTNAVYLVRGENYPFVVHLYRQDAQHPRYDDCAAVSTGRGEQLQVFAESLEIASASIEHLMRVASVGSVFRGQMLHVAPRGSGVPGQAIRVSDRPQIDRQRIVLPPEILQVVERTIASRLRFHRVLQQYGHVSKTGLLLHGAPGTGKTLVAKYLIGSCQNHTAIVPEGMRTETIRECFRLAAYLQPAIIVIEDVDLLAERRETNANVTGLQELMNEMDGLLPSTEAIVLMTTNRPEVLEPALASRPGRVSQAVCFPLPDAVLRKRLLNTFCQAADVSSVNWETWVQRTDGASPAFLEELVKKAILFAAERVGVASQQTPLQLNDEDFDRAMHDLVVYGGELTGSILGFPIAGARNRAVAAVFSPSAKPEELNR